MNLFHRMRQVLHYQICRITATPRIPLILVLLGIYIYSTVEPIRQFSMAVKIAAAPWTFPHLTNDFICQLIFMAGAIFIFCDAPFTDESNLYIVSRSGRVAWTGGHVLYILTMSFFYVVFIVILSIIPLIGNLQWSTEWGKILGTLARTNAAHQFGLTFNVNDYLTGAFMPINAMWISFLLEWACTAWLGLLIYFFNTVTHKMVGTFLSVVFLLLDIMISNEWTPDAFAFSPLTLSQLSSLTGMNQRHGITLNYSIKFYIISLCILIVLCISSSNFKKWHHQLKRKSAKINSETGKEIK